ncbi:MAG: methyl-accepting chemotaxis protein [Gammaproteobacteria bacterium]
MVKVGDGAKLVDASGQTLGEIVSAVKKVSDIIAEIAVASQEQSTGIEQVNKAVTQMDEMTQQNAALVEEAAAASEAMSEQAQALNGLMAFFRVGEGPEAVALAKPAYGGVERRGPGRPWAAKPKTEGKAPVSKPTPAKVAKVAQVATAQADSNEWEEF